MEMRDSNLYGQKCILYLVTYFSYKSHKLGIKLSISTAINSDSCNFYTHQAHCILVSRSIFLFHCWCCTWINHHVCKQGTNELFQGTMFFQSNLQEVLCNAPMSLSLWLPLHYLLRFQIGQFVATEPLHYQQSSKHCDFYCWFSDVMLVEEIHELITLKFVDQCFKKSMLGKILLFISQYFGSRFIRGGPM